MNNTSQPARSPEHEMARIAHLHDPSQVLRLAGYFFQELASGGAQAGLTMLKEWGHTRVAHLIADETARLSGDLRTRALRQLFQQYDPKDIFTASTMALSNAVHSIAESLMPQHLEQPATVLQKTRAALSSVMAKVPGVGRFFARDSGGEAGERAVKWDTTQPVGNIGRQPRGHAAARTRPSAAPAHTHPSWLAALLGPQAQPVPAAANVVHHGWAELERRQARHGGYPYAYARGR